MVGHAWAVPHSRIHGPIGAPSSSAVWFECSFSAKCLVKRASQPPGQAGTACTHSTLHSTARSTAQELGRHTRMHAGVHCQAGTAQHRSWAGTPACSHQDEQQAPDQRESSEPEKAVQQRLKQGNSPLYVPRPDGSVRLGVNVTDSATGMREKQELLWSITNGLFYVMWLCYVIRDGQSQGRACK